MPAATLPRLKVATEADLRKTAHTVVALSSGTTSAFRHRNPLLESHQEEYWTELAKYAERLIRENDPDTTLPVTDIVHQVVHAHRRSIKAPHA